MRRLTSSPWVDETGLLLLSEVRARATEARVAAVAVAVAAAVAATFPVAAHSLPALGIVALQPLAREYCRAVVRSNRCPTRLD
eukprot:6177084-Pleurochrysis_carterae.AAC.1